MNSYAHRWRLAVALKQPYPSPSETGLEQNTTNEIWFPTIERMQWFAYGAGATLIAWLARSAIMGGKR